MFGLINVVWGAGFLVGPAAGAALAEATLDPVTYARRCSSSRLAGAYALRPLALDLVRVPTFVLTIDRTLLDTMLLALGGSECQRLR